MTMLSEILHTANIHRQFKKKESIPLTHSTLTHCCFLAIVLINNFKRLDYPLRYDFMMFLIKKSTFIKENNRCH